MEHEYILSLSDPRAKLEMVGGKGASLARLASAGLLVPEGFHVTTAAYQAFVAENNLQSAILATLEDVTVSVPSSLEMASRAIGERFSQGQMPEEIVQSITQAYIDLPGDHPVVAVRSSATAEDLPDLSFAGQQETFLNIHGISAVLEAVRRCWASLWTARAIGYRLQHGIDQNVVSLAVVVQNLVHAEASGILFTANPVNGRRDQTMITASWGLGEAIVGGLVTPDTFTVDRTSVQVIDREIADKQVMTVLLESGTEEHPVPEAIRRVAVLTDGRVMELARTGNRIEEMYGLPMDIEWALAEGKVYILQARPITALPAEEQQPESAALSDVKWDIPDPRARYTRGSVVDFLPDPLSPLFATLGKPIYNAGLTRMIENLAGSGSNLGFSMITLNGYAYIGTKINVIFVLKFGGLLLGKIRWLLRTAESRWRDEALPQYAAVVKRWQDRPVDHLSGAELIAGSKEIMQETVDYLTVLQSGILGLAGFAESIFGGVYERFARREDDPPAATFLIGYNSTPIFAEKALYDLAVWCRGHSDLATYLQDTPTSRLASWLTIHSLEGPAPSGVDMGVWSEWLNRMGLYLEKYGHSIYDLDFSKPVPADDPTPILKAFKLYLAGGGRDPYKRQDDLARQREKATQVVMTRLKGLRLKIFRKALDFAQKYAPLREDSIADIGLGYPQLRRMLIELGHRFAHSGLVEQPEDIYWLGVDEVEQAAGSLEQGQPVDSLAFYVQERKALWGTQMRLIPPPMLPQKAKIAGINMEMYLPVDASKQTGAILKGVGASQGKATGTARVLHGPQDFSQMEPGDVLVASVTTPAWTPLFALASAIVTDIGGPLSHGSIVAREVGIPAVLGTGVATRRIQSGQVITVDGTKGTVMLETEKELQDRERTAQEEWNLPDPKGQYMRASICELLPDPLSPLFDTLGMSSIESGINVMAKDILNMPLDTLSGFMLAINGYAYQKVSFTGRQWYMILTRMFPRIPRLLKEGVPYWQTVAHPRYIEVTSHWQERNPGDLTSPEIWIGVQEIMAAFAHHLGSLMASTMGPTAGSEGLFTQVYEKMVMRPGDPSAPAFLLGFDSLPIKAEKALFDLSEWCREDSALTDFLICTPADLLIKQIDRHTLQENFLNGQWVEFRTRFHQYMKNYGYLIYDMDFAKPMPMDDPQPILETLKLFLTGQGKNPYTRQQEYVSRRQGAMAEARLRLKGIKRWAFEKTLKWAQSQAPLREDGIAEIGLGYPTLRRMLHELGRRFTEAGVIGQAEDIYWLEADEVGVAAAALEHGEPLQDLDRTVQDRKSLWQMRKRLTPPAQLPPGKKYLGLDMEGILAVGETTQEGSTIKGVSASPGQVMGTARVLHGPEDFDQMQPGDVLVASMTTPAWTPLFAMASAIVTDIGGPLSHGSIVAREYGIPAVLGTGVASRRIQSGQVVTVDGNAGLVTLHAVEKGNGRQVG